MFDYETTLSGIDFKVRQLIDENNRLKAQVMELTEKSEELTEVINSQKTQINNLIEETQIVKLRNTLVQKGDSAEIKLKINQLIRNIDKSLSQLTHVD
ncbi:MAG: hypothetical protein IKN84_05980 [Bacteroidales bacterium]|jgi:hypothetical protein|nr:hypothetical protein [Bacteroidales bacterium]